MINQVLEDFNFEGLSDEECQKILKVLKKDMQLKQNEENRLK